MTASEILDFALDELSVSLDPSKDRDALLYDLYRLGVVEEAVG